MSNRKKNGALGLQKQKIVISIPSDVWSEILRYFSRKQLCQQIHLVNRQLYDLASSRHNIPTTHVIYRMSFKKGERPPTFFNVFKHSIYNCVDFGMENNSKTLETQQLIKMPIPKSFVRFQKVYIYRYLGESTLKFLRDAKESFTGTAIHFPMIGILLNQDMTNQTTYLLQSIFEKPSYISLQWSCRQLSDLKVLTDGLPNCLRIKLNFWSMGAIFHGNISAEDTIPMLLDWLSSGKNVVQSLQRDTVQKHILLSHFLRTSISYIVQQIKDAFNDETLIFSDFVITFVQSKQNYFCLEGDHKFILNKISTNERLSFFTHNEFACSEPGSGRVYRLWCRRVVNESEDLKMATHLQNLEEWSRLGIDLCD